MSDTAETDAAALHDGTVVSADVARKLERERDELRRMSVTEMMAHNLNVKHHVTEWENRCIKAERERNEARELFHTAMELSKKYKDVSAEVRMHLPSPPKNATGRGIK